MALAPKMNVRSGTIIFLILAACPLMGQVQDDATPDGALLFRETVRPIIENRCLACHNQKVRSSGLSLESRPEVLTGGNRGPAVLPGDSEQSRLILALAHSSDLNMPPGESCPRRRSTRCVSGWRWGLPGTSRAMPATRATGHSGPYGVLPRPR